MTKYVDIALSDLVFIQRLNYTNRSRNKCSMMKKAKCKETFVTEYSTYIMIVPNFQNTSKSINVPGSDTSARLLIPRNKRFNIISIY